MSTSTDRLPEIVHDWTAIASKVLQEQFSIDPARAEEIGAQLAFELTQEYAGRNLYIPLSRAFKASQRDREIWAAYSAAGGRNIDELVTKYGMSHVHIRRICKRMRDLERAERQPALF